MLRIPDQVTVALASPRNCAAAVPMLAAQFREHRIVSSRAAIAATVATLVRCPRRGFILLAYLGDRPVGVAYVAFSWTLEHAGNTAWLEELYIVPALRSRGIGRALLDAIVERARRLGCGAIDLEVDATHSRASQLYQREGFTPLSRARWARKLLRPRRSNARTASRY